MESKGVTNGIEVGGKARGDNTGKDVVAKFDLRRTLGPQQVHVKRRESTGKPKGRQRKLQ